jgi:hypothetical protein
MDQRLGGDPNAPTSLATPERNRYFYGKLLDVPHFYLEQSYLNAKRWLLNRLVSGTGIVCGLAVVPSPDGTGVVISPGVAIDQWGREIVVASSSVLNPYTLTDLWGNPLGTVAGPVTVSICLLYHECGIEPTPVLVSTCDTNGACEPGTLAERYMIVVQQGAVLDNPLGCGLPGIFGSPLDSTVIQSDLLQWVTQPCPGPSTPACVCVAQVSLPAAGTITEGMIDQTGCAIVPNNQLLLQLILCLAQRVEECCGPTPTPTPVPPTTSVPTQTFTPPPTPTPTATPSPTPTPTPSPTPTPPPPQTFRVTGVEFLRKSVVVQTVKSPPVTTGVPAATNTIRVTFNESVSMLSVVAATSSLTAVNASFLVERVAPRGVISGTIKAAGPNAVDFISLDGFPKAEYEVILFGSPDPAHRRPAITSISNLLLDGEPNPTFPSGNGTQGGNFVFRFDAA